MRRKTPLAPAIKIIIGISILLTSFCSNAAFLSLDWRNAGDGEITVDTKTNLGWLDIYKTSHVSYNYILSQLGTGGRFEGFRYATANEVRQLLGNFGFTYQPDTYLTENFAPSQELFKFLGVTSAFDPRPDHELILGTTADKVSKTHQLAIDIGTCYTTRWFFCGDDTSFIQFSTLIRESAVHRNTDGYVFAHWLVKDNYLSVDEPPVISLMAFLAFYLFLRARKTRH